MEAGDRTLERRLARAVRQLASRPGARLTIDLDGLGFSLVVGAPGVGLRDLVASLPVEAQNLLQWLPNIAVNKVGLTFKPPAGGRRGSAGTQGEIGLFISAGLASSADSSAELLLAIVPTAKNTATLVGLNISSPIDLGGTPLFGSMLSGLTLRKLGVGYASTTIPADQPLPEPIPKVHPGFQQGLLLTLTLATVDAEQTFVLSPSQFRRAPRAVLPPLALPAPPDGTARADGAALTPLLTDAAALAPLPTDAPPTPPIQWFSVQKSFGPLTIGRIGIVTGGQAFGLALDAGINTAAVAFDLQGFTLTFPPNDVSLSGLTIDLAGLSLAVSAGALQISGGLVKTMIAGAVSYEGALAIKIGRYGIAAVGSYAQMNGVPSLFIFGLAEGPFGGPPAFYVTGLALGFGYNRGLKLPTPQQVQQFPLILAAREGSSYLPDAGPRAALAKLSEGGWVPPSEGDYWVAAGVKFRSFGLIDAFALLSVQFGHELVVSLLGIASLELPQRSARSTTYAYVEMTLSAVLQPERGQFQLTALLTPSSFIIDRACRLTGGFAFSLWFGRNDHAGDFVVTLGGYHPAYRPPDWYPSVPRLGLNWRMSNAIQLQGSVYFALTPSCVMGGGNLSLTFQSGDLRAWFVAHADFIMEWAPFSYDVSIGVSIGASYTLSVLGLRKTLSVELSADVQLWGPPLAGVAHVNWWVISFTIDINGGGSPGRHPHALKDWAAFAAASLPPPPPPQEALAAADPPKPLSTTSICRPHAASGLLGTVKDEHGNPIWIVSAMSFALATETVIPSTRATIGGNNSKIFDGYEVGVYPLGSMKITSIHTLELFRWADPVATRVAHDLSAWSWSSVSGKLPASLWGTQNTGRARLGAELIPGLVGVTGAPNRPIPTGPPPFSRSVLQHVELPPRPLPLPPTPVDGATTKPTVDPLTAVENTVANPTVVKARAIVAGVLNERGIGHDLSGGEMSSMERSARYTFAEPPMLGRLGTTGPRAERRAAVPPIRRAASPLLAAETRPSPTLRAVFRQYARPIAPAAVPHPWQRASLTSSTVHVEDALASRDERMVLRGFVGAPATAFADEAAEPETSASVQPGTTLLWDLAPRTQRTLQGDGDLPVRVMAFDRQYRLVDEVVLTGAGQPAYELPEPAVQAALTGLSGAVDREMVGWYGISTLLQVNPQALLGEGVVVRPQAPQRLGPARRSRGLGLTTARAMVRQNWVAGQADRERGWIETTLPAAMRTLVVTLQRETGSSQPSTEPEHGANVTIERDVVDDVAGARPRSLSLWQMLAADESADRFYAFYVVPNELHDPQEELPGSRLRVLVQPSAGWWQDGLLGFRADPDVVFAGEVPRALRMAAVSEPETRARETRITFR